MKKFFALALALVLTFALAVTCFAEYVPEMDALGESATQNVTVSYQAGAAAATVYSVDVVFESMAFTYKDTVMGTWNPETHSYNGTVDAHWEDADANITVTNHSNAAVAVTVAFAANGEYTGDATASITDGASFTLESAVDTAFEAAPSDTATLTVAGTGTAGETAAVIGTVTVTIAAAQ